MNEWELRLLDRIAALFHCAFFDRLMPVLTRFGDGGIFWITLTALLLIFPKTRKTGFRMGIALLTGFLVGNLFLKNVVARVRPFRLKDGVRLLIPPPGDYAFPSGHTLVCFEGAVVLMIRENKRWGVPALILAFLVAFSRLYLYVHYPTDVLAGAVLGTLFALLACFLANRIERRFGHAGKSE